MQSCCTGEIGLDLVKALPSCLDSLVPRRRYGAATRSGSVADVRGVMRAGALPLLLQQRRRPLSAASVCALVRH